MTPATRWIICALIGSMASWTIAATTGWAQVRMRRVDVGPVFIGGEAVQSGVAAGSDKAILKTDADLEALLVKAERYLEEGNYRITTRIWQEVIGRCGDTLFSSDGEVYYSVGRQVERRIAQLPPEGLRTYRISADAGAMEILAAAADGDRIAALNRVVNEYFLSSLGDEAAFELAARSLDNFDFVGAGRLLQRIVDDYPDPTVPMDQVWLRIAVCQAYSGNDDAATLALQEARRRAAPELATKIDQVATEIQSANDPAIGVARGDPLVWMRLSNSRRTGVMPSLPDAVMQSDLQPSFEYRIEPKKNFAEIVGAASMGSVMTGEQAAGQQATEAERTLYQRWVEREAHPTGYLLIDDQRVYYKSIADVTVWDKNDPGRQVVWRPAWLNQFIVDEGTRVLINLKNAYGGRRGGKRLDLGDDPEIFFLGDHVVQGMSLYQGVLYNIEGPSYDMTDSRAPRGNTQGNFQWGQVPRRTRSNFLTAYDARTGQLLWRVPDAPMPKTTRPAEESDTTPIDSAWDDVGFMGAPIGFGSLLIAPVNVSGSIYIYALDSRRGGKLVWRTYLTDEPASGAAFWSSIQLAVEGSDLFAVCGSGVLFVLEPATGGVRFARRYPRTGKPDQSLREFGIASERMVPDGWSEDCALPYRNVIIVLASDLNLIQAYDRQNGLLRWEAPLSAESDSRVFYLIGVHDDMLYAGGPNELIAYDLRGEGRMIWTASWTAREYLKDAGAKSYGRGMLTPDGVYLPIKDSILKLDLRSGKPLGHAGLRLGYDGVAGNLFSDGEKIWMVNANRLIALQNVPPDENENDDDTRDTSSGEQEPAGEPAESDGSNFLGQD